MIALADEGKKRRTGPCLPMFSTNSQNNQRCVITSDDRRLSCEETGSTEADNLRCLTFFLPATTLATTTTLPTWYEDHKDMLLCVLGRRAVTALFFPPDGACTHTFYAHVVMEDGHIRESTDSPGALNTSLVNFLEVARNSRLTEFGISFDFRWGSFCLSNKICFGDVGPQSPEANFPSVSTRPCVHFETIFLPIFFLF